MTPPDRAEVDERLRAAHNYWLATVRPDGRPHLVPIWGLWLEGRFWFTSFAGPKLRNIAVNPEVVLSTETPGEVVLLDGRAATVDEDALPAGYVAAYDAKYGAGWSGVGDPKAALVRVTPTALRAWHEGEAMQPPARFDVT